MGHQRITLQKSTYEKIRPFVKGRKILKRLGLGLGLKKICLRIKYSFRNMHSIIYEIVSLLITYTFLLASSLKKFHVYSVKISTKESFSIWDDFTIVMSFVGVSS